ncbi:MFS general substrate transporter [Phanerochaete sordida]|uniref:MFS general substrate transporter n=1 Tax=Phanerochaete sordida TaxID=48140 RepID=A0A9P3FY38_9APHY|nr:MFS general substrate transporter [Phanerochaete sordida]
MTADSSRKELTPSPVTDDEKQDYAVEHIDYRTRFPAINERKLLRKIDFRLVPVLCILYLLAFLDRVNISNAALYGLKTDLKLTGDEYNTALVVFFVPYILFEIPSNTLMKRFKPHVWLSGCMFFFGLTTCLQGLTQNYSGLIATRFFLGMFESGMFPGCFYLLAMWYKRSESQKRYSFFFSSTTLAGAFGGLLATAIGKMDGMRGYKGWRWVFILEGLLTCVVGLLFYFLISDFPEEAKWLSPEEKEFVKARLQEDVGHSQRHEPLKPKQVFKILSEWKIILGGFMYFGLIVPAYGYAYFAPAIIQSLGHSAVRTQLLSVPPWACAFGLAMTLAIISDKIGHRFLFTIIPSAISLAGFSILFHVHNNSNLQYAALFLAAAGAYASMPVIVCWYATNLAGHRRRAVGTGWQVGFGNIGGIIAAYSFLSKDAPKYSTGYSICISFVCLSMVACTAYFLHMSWLNRKRDREQDNGPHLSWEEKQELGDLNPDYRYLL